LRPSSISTWEKKPRRSPARSVAFVADMVSAGAPHSMKWKDHPNLRLRPVKPALGRGRIQRQVRRAFMASDSPVLSSSDIYRWVYPRKKRPRWLERWSVFVVLRKECHRVGRTPPYGAWLWRLRDQ
jgi:hypothetical protein